MRSFPRRYNKDRHEFNVHGTWLNEDSEPLSVKPNTLGGVHSRDSEPLSVKPNLLEDVSEPPKILNPLDEDEGTEDEDIEDEDTESNDSEPPKKKKKQLSDSESEEESDEEQEMNKYDLDIGDQLIAMTKEGGSHVKAMLVLLNINHQLKKSNIYENIRSAARHYDDVGGLIRKDLMKKAVLMRKDDIKRIVERCSEESDD